LFNQISSKQYLHIQLQNNLLTEGVVDLLTDFLGSDNFYERQIRRRSKKKDRINRSSKLEDKSKQIILSQIIAK
jgi:hypothetical protein